MRERSRAEYIAGGIGTAAIKTLKNNVVGSGLKVKPKLDFELLGISEEEAKKWSREVEKRFEFWANSKNCDVMGLNNFYELQAIHFMATLLNGDSFAFLTYDKNLNLRLNIVEADRICTPNNMIEKGTLVDNEILELENGNVIVSGIEFNKDGGVVAIHVANTYDNFVEKKWQRVEVINKNSGLPNVLFSFEAERPSQTRGVPFLAHVMEIGKQLNRYIAAELNASIINSSFVGFIHTDSPGQFNLAPQINDDTKMKERTQRANELELGTGTFYALGENEKISYADPTRPNSGFENFVTTMLQIMGSIMEIPYEELLKTFNSSYSASRASLLEAWATFNRKREWLKNDFCQKVYEVWLFQQISTGKIKAKGFMEDEFKRNLWCETMWLGTRPRQIDPVKEVDASIKAVENGLSTREKEALELNGTDFTANAKTLKNEKELLGLNNNFGGDENGQEDKEILQSERKE